MSKFTLAAAERIVAAAYAKGKELGLKPLTVAVLDAGGHVVVLSRQDGSSILRPQIASGKAFGALAVGAGTRFLDAAAQTRPHFITALGQVSGGSIVPVPGGVLVRESAGGEVLGAVGISDDTSDMDEACAIAGIEAAGFAADVG